MTEMIEDTIQEMTIEWATYLLDEPDVTLEDNFVDCGGHSILALRMNRLAKEQWGTEYNLAVLLESDLAAAADDLASRLAR
ncbi:phosphopantetheine-binding protein [Streptomonospora salina]|uniref:Carrier domain-containing protein n=1 Tax=Streptomonospora salina TaxID=104205 RepID=A0A841EG53_9ACTN|nr:phosphopantetheine-binding protein [Streptomonospora salina]MBB6000023.1 hypothetical protein [Streptomonospora salina]